MFEVKPMVCNITFPNVSEQPIVQNKKKLENFKEWTNN